MGRWGAMDPVRAMQERAADAAHRAAQAGVRDMQRRVRSPRFEAEERGEFRSFEGQPEPVHPRSELPAEQAQHNLSQSQFRALHMTAQGIMDTHQGLAGDRNMVPDPELGRGRPETHSEFWGRKAEEHEDSGMAHVIRTQGYNNRYPISLRTPGTSGPIETERPEILGGHHRLAQMVKEAPNQLLSVRHFGSTQQAKDVLGRRY